jgi:uncharacterized membrane protein
MPTVGRVLGLATAAGIAFGVAAYALPWTPRLITRGVLAGAVVALAVVVGHLLRTVRDRDDRLDRIERIVRGGVHHEV